MHNNLHGNLIEKKQLELCVQYIYREKLNQKTSRLFEIFSEIHNSCTIRIMIKINEES